MKRALLVLSLSVFGISLGWLSLPADAQDGDATATVRAVQTTVAELAATITSLQTTVSRFPSGGTPSASTPVTTQSQENGRCTAVPQDAQDFIMTGMQKGTPHDWQMVQSKDLDPLWFIAAYLDDVEAFQSGKYSVSLWAMDHPEDVSKIADFHSVNEIAGFVSGSRLGDRFARVSYANDGAKEAIACVLAAVGNR